MNMPSHHDQTGHTHQSPPSASSPAVLKDPVCGMTVTEKSEHRFEHEGQPYYFCSAKCQGKFAANPLQYLAQKAPVDAVSAVTGTIYTCPMHPEIRQDHPGNCPICGMTLEPVVPTLDVL